MKNSLTEFARGLFLCAAVLLLNPAPWQARESFMSSSAQESGSGIPPAETILDRYVEVTGGKAAYRSLNNILSKGTFYVVGTSTRGKYSAYEAVPDKTRTIFEFEGGRKDEMGVNGGVAWEVSTATGPRLLAGEEKAVALREATFNSMLNWRRLYRKVACSSTEAVGDRTCYRVVLAPADGRLLTQFYDVGSGYLLKSFIVLGTPAGEIRSENLYDDYRKENVEVLFPHKLTQRFAGQETVVTMDSVRGNVDIAWYRFDLPAGVTALLRKLRP